MANNSRTNPFQVDSTGGLVNPLTEVRVNGIMITPSNATWSLIIKDGVGNTKFSANNLSVGACMIPDQFASIGLEVTTLSNCTALIYVY
jgi:hypothetical protein